jgi:uncharacterized membrane protein
VPFKIDKKTFFKNSLHLFFAILLVVTTPFVLNSLSKTSLDNIRKLNPISQSKSELQNLQGKVVRIILEKTEKDPLTNTETVTQELDVQITSQTNDKNKVVKLTKQANLRNPQDKLAVGDLVVVQKSKDDFYLVDRYRLPAIFWLLIAFLVLIIVLAGFRGITAFLGLIFSLMVLVQFLVPQILNGGNLLIVAFSTSLIIGVISIFLSHGFEKRSRVSSVSIVICLVLATVFSYIAVTFSRLSGLTSDEVFTLQTTRMSGNLNFQGLLLAGIIIGSLGVLDDVIMAQATAVEEISSANPSLTFWDLVTRGMRIGREHVISMINSLAFAYVGSSLPLLMLFVMYDYTDLLTILNSEIVAEELVRTMVGSMTLLLAIPITTLLSARFLQAKNNSITEQNFLIDSGQKMETTDSDPLANIFKEKHPNIDEYEKTFLEKKYNNQEIKEKQNLNKEEKLLEDYPNEFVLAVGKKKKFKPRQLKELNKILKEKTDENNQKEIDNNENKNPEILKENQDLANENSTNKVKSFNLDQTENLKKEEIEAPKPSFIESQNQSKKPKIQL